MPLYDFQCLKCQNIFEEITSTSECPPCPKCMSEQTERQICAPSPLKTNPFPYKIGPVRPSAPMRNNSTCPANSGGFS